jgi:hypothetical protein
MDNRHMKRKKLPAAALVLTITGETLLSAHHSDAAAPPQPHTQLEIPTPPANTVSVISAGGAESAPFALDSDDWGALPFRTTYASHTNLSAVLGIFQDDAIGAPRPI